MLDKFNKKNCNTINTPVAVDLKLTRGGEGKIIDPALFRSLIGSLRYHSITRPDIVYSVGLLSKYMEKPKESHWLAAKRILRYIKGTMDFGLLYSYNNDATLYGYSDSDWGGDQVERKSTTRYVFTWMSKKLSIVALSTCEDEYVVASSSVCEAIWLKNLLKEFDHSQEESIIIYVDNKPAIELSKNPIQHGRSKHIDMKYHFLRDYVKKKVAKLQYCNTEEQVANIFTKALPVDRFKRLRTMLSVKMVLV